MKIWDKIIKKINRHKLPPLQCEYEDELDRFHQLKYLIELKYIGNGKYLFNDDILTTIDEIERNTLNLLNFHMKQKIDSFIRELKIHKITKGNDSDLIGRIIVRPPKKGYV